MKILKEQEIKTLVTIPESIQAIEDAFAKLARGEARLPDVINLDIPEVNGEIHVKGAHLKGDLYCVFKIATGFYKNVAKGLPTGSGLMIALDARTGFIAALLRDNGYLTDLRTGAAGAVATKYLANKELKKVAVIGGGTQARFQLRTLAAVRDIPHVKIFDIVPENAERCCEEMASELNISITPASNIEEAVSGADLVYTVTPSKKPLIRSEWLSKGVHINAIGSDGPDKQELDVNVLSHADIVIADRVSQCIRLGEIHHALAGRIITEADITGELGEVILGKVPGRSDAEQITVCDLTGVGIQDAAIVSLVLRNTKKEINKLE